MSSVDSQQKTDFTACFDAYREASGGLIHAIQEHKPDEAKGIYESLTATLEKVGPINKSLKAAKRKERRDKIAELMPKIGDEGLVDICPDGNETWTQFGRVLLAWADEQPAERAVWAAIEITRAMTDEENAGLDWQSDDTWNGCVIICRYSDYFGEWRAKYPVNDRAIEAWGTDDE